MTQIESGGREGILRLTAGRGSVQLISVSLSLSRKTKSIGQAIIVYDDELISQIDTALFDPATWPEAQVAGGPGGGRGKVLIFSHAGQRLALRHYYRGGMARFLSADRYLWTGPEQTRSFREWTLLAQMHTLGLPVPRPVAARVIRRGLFYSADLITSCLPNVESLSQRLMTQELPAQTWAAVGELIARFHAQRILHADLNAHNIQIGTSDELYLLDFDRGRIMAAPGSWSADNLARLQRSLLKLQQQYEIHFSADNWQTLLDVYQASMSGR